MQSLTGFQRRIARYLPASMNGIMYGYLYYIRPFVTTMEETLSAGNKYQSSLMWPGDETENYSWPSDKLRQVLQRNSERIIGFKLNIARYRHIAITIDPQYSSKSSTCFGWEISSNSDGSEDEGSQRIRRSIIDSHDHQAGHSSSVARLHYGVLHGQAHCGLDPSLFEIFRIVSLQMAYILRCQEQTPDKITEVIKQSNNQLGI